MKRLRFPVLTAALALLVASRTWAQCALCRDAVAASSVETREAFNAAIIGLALAPYGIALIAAFALSPAFRAFIRLLLLRLRASMTGERS